VESKALSAVHPRAYGEYIDNPRHSLHSLRFTPAPAGNTL